MTFFGPSGLTRCKIHQGGMPEGPTIGGGSTIIGGSVPDKLRGGGKLRRSHATIAFVKVASSTVLPSSSMPNCICCFLEKEIAVDVPIFFSGPSGLTPCRIHQGGMPPGPTVGSLSSMRGGTVPVKLMKLLAGGNGGARLPEKLRLVRLGRYVLFIGSTMMGGNALEIVKLLRLPASGNGGGGGNGGML